MRCEMVAPLRQESKVDGYGGVEGSSVLRLRSERERGAMPLSEAGFTRLKKLVRKATKAGAVGIDVIDGLALDEEVLRDTLVLVRSGGASAARTASDLVRRVLESENAKLRYRGLLLADELFLRSKAFRSRLCTDIRGFVRSVMRIPGLSELPPPEKAQVLLHRTALFRILPNWRKHFAREQPSLTLVMQFIDAKLGRIGRVLGGRHEQEARRRRERSRRLRRAQFETVCDEMSAQSGSELFSSMEGTLYALTSALDLLDARFDALTEQFRAETGRGATTSAINANDDDDEDEDEDDDFFDVDWSGVEPPALAPAPSHAPATTGANAQGSSSPEVDDDLEEWASFHHDAREREAHRARENKLVEHLDPNFRLEVNMRPAPTKADVVAESDLGPVVASFREALHEAVRTHSHQLERWIQVLTRAELGESTSRMRRGDLLRVALDMKRGFKDAKERGEAFGIHVDIDTNVVEDTDFLGLLEGGTVGEFVDARTKEAKALAKKRRRDAAAAGTTGT
ncbi:UV-stimulated scaffold protein A [Hondaea fermentalgiana]|uniref:UV-stimulated scaffold protein A n=1 Tax=Hondaea fermentalgiana TaxID=2315210 RepID=A0A2R5GLR0_9STRA|nr:UV-stimulated scaffold protein A [Hondaea fermentalgiana]|eukprot:GBG29563.1 UV-stimulated scaffold protein A [Hondaea fermentalgiana]